jgi:hypothetical protein
MSEFLNLMIKKIDYECLIVDPTESKHSGYMCGRMAISNFEGVGWGEEIYYRKYEKKIDDIEKVYHIVKRENAFRKTEDATSEIELQIDPRYVNSEYFFKKRVHEYHLKNKTDFDVIWAVNQVLFSIKKYRKKKDAMIKKFAKVYSVSEGRLREEIGRINAFRGLAKKDYQQYVKVKNVK